MRYLAIITREGTATLAEFPDCPGCQTFVRKGDDPGIEAMAVEALHGWLESMLAAGDEIPEASKRLRVPRGARAMPVEVSPMLAVKIALRLARRRAHLTQAELAKRAGVSQQQVARVESPDSNPTLGTLEKIADALGATLEIGLVPRHA